jgi:uncharacterized protein
VSILYFDASAFVKLFLEEEGSDLVERLWDTCDIAVSSRLSYVEVCAALGAAHRNRDITKAIFDRSLTTWNTFWDSVHVIELTHSVTLHAGGLAPTHGLKGSDAIQLASALTVKSDDSIMAVWDNRLRSAAQSESLIVIPATVHS